MKKTLITTAVAFALGFSMNALATDKDELMAPAALTTSADGGVLTAGEGSEATNKANNSYNSTFDGSLNNNITSGFNDVNSHNTTTIDEDGIVAFAQDIDQAVATSDLEHLIGQPLGIASTTLSAAGVVPGNLMADNSAIGSGAAGAISNLNPISFENAKSNVINNGSFNNHGGVLSAAQNVGSLYSVGQSVVVQSNGGL